LTDQPESISRDLHPSRGVGAGFETSLMHGYFILDRSLACAELNTGGTDIDQKGKVGENESYLLDKRRRLATFPYCISASSGSTFEVGADAEWRMGVIKVTHHGTFVVRYQVASRCHLAPSDAPASLPLHLSLFSSSEATLSF
jgi:hypothetical protein